MRTLRTLCIPSARLVHPAMAVVVLASVAACGGGGSSGTPEPVNAISTANCTQANLQVAVAGLTGDLKTAITSVALSPAGATVNGAAVSSTNPALPEHCVVTGTIDEHTGEPGNTVYGNKIRLRMPTAWNGRFYFMGGGGNNGSVADAVGTFRNMPGHSALARGYAVVAQDSGHNGSSPSFALDQKAYVNFAHQSVHDAKSVSNTLLEKYFGRGPQRSYFVGCSNGGREAMVTAQRYDDFDGVVAGAPALNMFDQWTADVWSLRAVAELAGTAPGVAATATSQAFSDAQLSFIAKHFIDKCDALDGVADGLVQRFGQCKATAVDYQQMQCSTQGGSSSNASCLSPAQTSALAKIYGGPVNSAGVSLATGSNPGGIEANWRSGLLGSGVGGLGSWYQSIIPNLPYMGYGFLGYPGAAVNPRAVSAYPTGPVYAAGFNFDRDPALLEPGRLMFHGDNLDTHRAGPNFERFIRRGAKMIIYSGTADASVKAPSVAEFADKLQTSYGQERAESFSRTFFVPGMGHCGGGPATDVFDVLTPLVDWVEKGEAPQRIVAQATAGSNLDPNRTGVSRPLCVYPRYARYNGSGDVANAANYSCAAS